MKGLKSLESIKMVLKQLLYKDLQPEVRLPNSRWKWTHVACDYKRKVYQKGLIKLVLHDIEAGLLEQKIGILKKQFTHNTNKG